MNQDNYKIIHTPFGDIDNQQMCQKGTESLPFIIFALPIAIILNKLTEDIYLAYTLTTILTVLGLWWGIYLVKKDACTQLSIWFYPPFSYFSYITLIFTFLTVIVGKVSLIIILVILFSINLMIKWSIISKYREKILNEEIDFSIPWQDQDI